MHASDHTSSLIRQLKAIQSKNCQPPRTVDIEIFQNLLRRKTEDWWIKEGERRALRLFHAASRQIPAYKDFLKKHRVNPTYIKTIKDFAQNIPITDKKNYIQKYPLKLRCWNGTLDHLALAAVSSGTIDKPQIWPRGPFQEWEATLVHRLLYTELFGIKKYTTLAVVAFPMGSYISGVATALPTANVAYQSKYLTLVTPGNQKGDVLRLTSALASQYEQILFIGHPFFIKDILETAIAERQKWMIDAKKKSKIRMFFCSEGFTEDWRSYMAKLVNSDQGKDLISLYGSSELLLMGYETLFTITLRQIASQDRRLAKELFESEEVPNLFQYNPILRYIESVRGELIFTSSSGVPSIRYNIHDSGEVKTLENTKTQLLDHNHSINLRQRDVWNLPLITLRGRSDYTIVFYAANIYPEHVHKALSTTSFLKVCTGKFTMEKVCLKDHEQSLEINVELRHGIKVTSQLTKNIGSHIYETLMKLNNEYNDASKRMGKDIKPRVRLWPYQSQRYFKLGSKPQYIKR